MPVRVGVVVFPGSNCDRDTVHALDLAGAEPVVLWHEQASLEGVAAVVLPGGFAYGDYVRAGVIARFSPVMRVGRRVRRRWRAGARHLQRLPGPGRGRARARARCCATRRCGSPARRSRSPPSGSTRRSPTRSMRAARCACRSPTARAASTRTTRRSTRWSATARSSSATSMPTARPARPDDSGQPERLAPRDRRRAERGRQRGRPDAPSGASLGGRSSARRTGSAIIRSLVESAERAARDRRAAVAIGAVGSR